MDNQQTANAPTAYQNRETIICNTDDVKLRDGIVRGVKEAVELAENAVAVITDHRSDEKVQQMCKYILGEDDLDNKLHQAKATLEAIKSIPKEPSQFRPQDDGWKQSTSNRDIEIHCDASRFVKRGKFQYDVQLEKPLLSRFFQSIQRCYDTNVVPASGTTRAITWSSDIMDYSGYINAGGAANGVDKADYTTVQPNRPNIVDLCSWYTKRLAEDGWPKIDEAGIEKAKSDEFREKLRGEQTPVDTILNTLGTDLLHEFTHTNLGGQLVDVNTNNLPDGTRRCYGWRCVGALHDVRNSDSINMLGVALKVWSLKHYVNDDGEILPRD
ncbi:hypothetical protein DL769_004005 [Monosporascus sp. CRB-8-3]|nr:hypothetical protein DL769_004005 [Monosporascus sp. CRB-8-3]